MIELMVALVAILVLSAGLLQIAGLTKAQTDTMTEARRRAGQKSLISAATLESANYISAMQEGTDNKQYTADDTYETGAPASFKDNIINRTVEDQNNWNIIRSAPDTHFMEMKNSSSPENVFGMVQGESSESVPLISTVQSLLYRSSSIEIKSEVWMTRTGDIY